eukprot:CAMPEP_0202946792 /NCGR_PEP_ID=MMETSP1395-20130829/10298_1 /ASSEMBLY_ACC=CAM_ASM_000871 /TAXON_ID=5961 /ORGANISM="Blepharisma japonicum, Strain Stock R1072" /LENGTH=121 /DNA_ID=CAMNT_0049647603 /DNA_START=24 /DNA_END=389 /DNA_ORIENTATION=-
MKLLAIEKASLAQSEFHNKSKFSRSVNSLPEFFKATKDLNTNENFPGSGLIHRKCSEISRKPSHDNYAFNRSSEVIIACTHEYTRIFNDKLSEMMDFHKETILKLINNNDLDGNQDLQERA